MHLILPCFINFMTFRSPFVRHGIINFRTLRPAQGPEAAHN